MTTNAFGDAKIKKPNVAWQFYTGDPKELTKQVDSFLKKSPVKAYSQHIDIVIVPHAGYTYSGQIAAHGFKAVSQNKYKTIIVIAADHRFGFDGISIWPEGGFETPLGVINVDRKFAEDLISKNEKFYFEPNAFAQEHSLEVELPFLQRIFNDFQLVPVVMGHVPFQLVVEFAKAIDQLVGDRKDVLLVISTDMSHFHSDKTARALDHDSIELIKKMDVENYWNGCQKRSIEMCGFIPVTTALLYAQANGLTEIDHLGYSNSGDVSGDKNRVVGYTSFVIYGNGLETKTDNVENDSSQGNEEKSPFTKDQKKRLLTLARRTIEEYLRTGKKLQEKEDDPRLMKKEGAFVTLHKDGRLRGCIGNILGRGPLHQTIRNMAISSATQDHRFSPVKEEELAAIDIEISVLSVPKEAKHDEIVMGKHGVIVSKGPFNSGVFLPQVATDTGWTKEEFLSQLCYQKAGLPSDCWKDPSISLQIFTAEVFGEKDFAD